MMSASATAGLGGCFTVFQDCAQRGSVKEAITKCHSSNFCPAVLKTNGYNVLRGDQGQTIDIHSSSVGTITTRFCSGLSLGLRSSVCARRMVPIARHRVLRAETDCRGQAACRAKTTHRTQAPILIVYRLIARAKTTSQHVAQRSPTSAYAGRQEK